MEKIKIKQYFLTAPDGSLHFTSLEEEDFSSDLSTGLSRLARGLLRGATDVAAWSNSEPKSTIDIICAGLKRMGELCGDALYDILITMASPQLIRYPLFEGQGNFGWWCNKDRSQCDFAASACFTEARLSPIGERIAKSLNDDLHPFPFPTMLVVGMMDYKYRIPPHNLSEVIDACLAMLDNSEITLDELLNYIQGPDFPDEECEVVSTAATLKNIYETGHGRISLKNNHYIVNMCALKDGHKYVRFNLRDYLRIFISESRKNIEKYAQAMLTQLHEKETMTKQESIAREIEHYEHLLSSPSEIDQLLHQQLNKMKELFGDDRRTRIRYRETRARR